MKTATNISTARANRIAQKLAESKLSGQQQIRLRLECGLELDQLKTELTDSGRVRDPETRKTRSTFRWGDYCAEQFPGIALRTIDHYRHLGLWSAVNSEISEQLIEQSDSWTDYCERVAQYRREQSPLYHTQQRFHQQTVERAAATRAHNRRAQTVSDSPETGISYNTARRIEKLRGMCSDTGPEGDTARARFEKLTGETPEQFYKTGRSIGLASCANSLDPEQRRTLLESVPVVAETLVAVARENKLDRTQLVFDFAATLLEHIDSLPIEFNLE